MRDWRFCAQSHPRPVLASVALVEDGFREALDRQFRQLESLVDLYSLLRPRAPMPRLRGWPASPDMIHTLVEAVWSGTPELVVECGSGASSVWLGYAVERVGNGRVVALEHDPTYWERSRALVRMHGLHRLVDIRRAPLRRWSGNGETWRWYSRAAVRDLTGIGVLFIDGPPGDTGPLARYPAVPELLPRCAADAVIVLDDADRADELAISDRWLAEFPELERTVVDHEKGGHIFTRPGGAGGAD
jgi:predicted O-methyltransferase YrrM